MATTAILYFCTNRRP